jgi:hypothetical protein
MGCWRASCSWHGVTVEWLRIEIIARSHCPDQGNWHIGNDKYTDSNEGNGTFATAVKYAAGTDPVGAVVADFNGDQKPDLAVADAGAAASTGGVSLLLGTGKGIFAAARPIAVPGVLNIASIATGDIDGNGKPDLVLSAASAYSDPALVTLLNQGNAVFEAADVQAYSYYGVANPGQVVLGNFTGPGPLTAAVIDQATSSLNVPGDIAVSSNTGSPGSTVGYGTNGSYLSTPLAIAAGTFNGDGRLGLAAIDQVSNKLYILNGNGDGTFTLGANYVAPTGARSVADATFSADGEYTIAVVGAGGLDIYYQ